MNTIGSKASMLMHVLIVIWINDYDLKFFNRSLTGVSSQLVLSSKRKHFTTSDQRIIRKKMNKFLVVRLITKTINRKQSHELLLGDSVKANMVVIKNLLRSIVLKHHLMHPKGVINPFLLKSGKRFVKFKRVNYSDKKNYFSVGHEINAKLMNKSWEPWTKVQQRKHKFHNSLFSFQSSLLRTSRKTLVFNTMCVIGE